MCSASSPSPAGPRLGAPRPPAPKRCALPRPPSTPRTPRRASAEALPRARARHLRDGRPVALLAIDVDHFKQINDTWGHAAGDVTLRLLGSLLTDQVRATDTVGRIGGEEFGVILPDCDTEQARKRAERLLAAIRTESGHWDHSISVSIGVAVLPENAATTDELQAAADSALYEAKAAGRDRVRVAALVG